MERHPPENWRVVRVFDDLRSEGDVEWLNRTWQVELGDDQTRDVVRFGDGEPGSRPSSRTAIEVTYRIGGGEAGNVSGAPIGDNRAVRNPVPAGKGADPEPTEPVRRIAPRSTGAMSRKEVLGRALAAAEGWEIHDFATEDQTGGDYPDLRSIRGVTTRASSSSRAKWSLRASDIKSTDRKERDGSS